MNYLTTQSTKGNRPTFAYEALEVYIKQLVVINQSFVHLELDLSNATGSALATAEFQSLFLVLA